MALSPAHRFGQIIGELLEKATIERIRPIAESNAMYLDYTHPRLARENRANVRVPDTLGNYHNLDIVLEEGGSESEIGNIRAFIEVAWRRYTKHSKNKAQEISSAVLGCAKAYADSSPFLGTVLAGEFTDTSLKQLRSQGFVVVHFSMEAVVIAFEAVGINAYWEESTDEAQIQREVDKYNSLSDSDIRKIEDRLFEQEEASFEEFKARLCNSLKRRVKTIEVRPLWGEEVQFTAVNDATDYIENVTSKGNHDIDFIKFEIAVTYTNGITTKMKFEDKNAARIALALIGQ